MNLEHLHNEENKIMTWQPTENMKCEECGSRSVDYSDSLFRYQCADCGWILEV